MSVIPRPRQQVFVDRSVSALAEHDSVLGVAPTGAGKSLLMPWVWEGLRDAGTINGSRALFLQHRDELVGQNLRAFQKVNKGVAVSEFTSRKKRFAGNGGATFAMVPTLVGHLDKMPAFDLVIIDEAHHALAPTWRKIIDRARELNDAVKVFGVTATPCRGDRQGLGEVFDTCSDQILLGELIRAGHLVPPRARVLDVGLGDSLAGVRKTRLGEYDMHAVEELMLPATEAVIDQWQEHAGDRQTVVFCSTVEHALQVHGAFVGRGLSAICIDGTTSKTERAAMLRAYDRGDEQVFVNVAVATEGWDHQPTSCVVLLRPSSFQSTLIQMIGRGLRTVDPKRYPGVRKVDCEVLDFGRSLLTHGGIEQALDLEGRPPGEKPQKLCPACRKLIARAAKQCPMCAHVFPIITKPTKKDSGSDGEQLDLVTEVRLIELDLLINESPFAWWQLHQRCRVVTALDVWAVAFADRDGTWHTFGGTKDDKCVELAAGGEVQCVAAGDDWMRIHGDRSVAAKNARWMGLPPTDKQLALLDRMKVPTGRISNRYEAACQITLKFAKRYIAKQMAASPTTDAAAEAA